MLMRWRWRGTPILAAALLPWLGCGAPTPGVAPSAVEPRPLPDAPSAVPDEASAWPRIVIDEVLPANDSRLPDERGDADDWIDLYNPGSETVELSGWSLSDGGGTLRLPTGTHLEPGAHLIVWADGEPEEGPLHAGFSLDGGGEGLRLSAPDGTIVDRVAWPALPDDVVWGRFPSGSPFLASSIVATPGNANPVDPGASLDPSDALFPAGGVIRLDLWLDDAAQTTLLEDPEAFVPAALAFEESWLYPVGLTLKGGIGSFRTFDQKAGFRIDTDRFVPGLVLRGQERLTLNNLVQDRSNVNQVLAYTLLRDAGVPAPRAAHVELWMNGEYRGLYLNLETADEAFLRRRFDDPDGNLYEGTYGADLRSDRLGRFDREVQGEADVTDGSDLASLTEFLDQEPTEERMPELERRIDLDEWLRAMAAEVVLGQFDGYLAHTNNFRLYHEPSSDRFTLMPWGTDQTFRQVVDPWDAKGVVGAFCFAIPSCERRYDLALRELSDRLAALDCEARVAALAPVLEPLYAADPLVTRPPESVQRWQETTVSWCSSSPERIRGWLP